MEEPRGAMGIPPGGGERIEVRDFGRIDGGAGGTMASKLVPHKSGGGS